jgi:hypothetical protein
VRPFGSESELPWSGLTISERDFTSGLGVKTCEWDWRDCGGAWWGYWNGGDGALVGVVVVEGMDVVGDGGVVVGEGEFELGVVESVGGGGLSFLRRMVVVLLGREMNDVARPFGMGDSVSIL